ncbi:MAG: DSBA oxidoreductase [Candidatus Gottesmanbacteria bacterium GW2011_GWA2_47_9]|uniref:DSBA oxidoreductase n=1 Tax=Candidatus Gottesmanbacteria bacterium GW2011_GWA2_47_9 TaxID=1618445 RepID=A0A0G1U006_9BACT|nr:MAG: DSBA oxidoreductase [Candidatus Gottesmanbacteria bacterium GW2011_GWA2_47_9]
MKLTSETKLFLGIIVATVALIAGAVVLFSKPAPTLSREQLVPPGGVIRGNPDAAVFLVEFSDFQCPACAAFAPVVNDIVEKNKDKLLFAYRHFPLDQHAYAVKAAIAAEAAAQQGKFWEMSDLLFVNQTRLSDELVLDFAKQLDLRMEAFTQDLAREDLKQKVQADRAYALQIGINSTPTFFLNGKKLNVTSLDDLKNQVEKSLQ